MSKEQEAYNKLFNAIKDFNKVMGLPTDSKTIEDGIRKHHNPEVIIIDETKPTPKVIPEKKEIFTTTKKADTYGTSEDYFIRFNVKDEVDMLTAFREARNHAIEYLTKLVENSPRKINIAFKANAEKNVVKREDDGTTSSKTVKKDLFITTDKDMKEVVNKFDVERVYDKLQNDLFTKVDEVLLSESGIVITDARYILIQSSSFNPTGEKYVDLPDNVKNKKACINVKNKDNQCFKWAVLSALHPPKDHVDRIKNYEKYKDELIFTGIDFPFVYKDAKKFENQNTNIAIYIFAINDDATITPKYISIHHKEIVEKESKEEELDKKIIDIGLYNNHYVWIKNISAMVNKAKHEKSTMVNKGRKHKAHICRMCCTPFTSSVFDGNTTLPGLIHGFI
jgi:hypothetical protein